MILPITSASAQLEDQAQALEVEVLSNHHWRNPLNFAGWASGLSDIGVSYLVPGLPTLYNAHAVLGDLLRGIDLMEQYALSAWYLDKSDPRAEESSADALRHVIAETQRVQVEAVAAPSGLTTTRGYDWVTHTRLTANMLQAAAYSLLKTVLHLQVVQGQLVRLGLSTGLLRADFVWASRPWLWRDLHPNDDRSLAFAAALSVGERPFAYRLFAPI